MTAHAAILNDEEVTALLEIWEKDEPLTLQSLDAEIVAEQARQIRYLKRDLRDARQLFHNYRQGIRQYLEDQALIQSHHRQIELLKEKFEDQHPGFPLNTWKWDVKHDQTALGYWEWLAEKLDEEAA